MAVKQRRPIQCYSCGKVLGYIEVELNPKGMSEYRSRRAELLAEHRCEPAGKKIGA